MDKHNSIDEHEHHKHYSIIVNGRKRFVTEQHLTYLEVVHLAYPDAKLADNIIYTVTFSHPNGGGHEGSLVEGQKVAIKEGMIFNVTKTDKS